MRSYHLTLDSAIEDANRRATCGWHFSVLEKINVHLRDYVFIVVPHVWDEALYISIGRTE